MILSADRKLRIVNISLYGKIERDFIVAGFEQIHHRGPWKTHYLPAKSPARSKVEISEHNLAGELMMRDLTLRSRSRFMVPRVTAASPFF